MATKVKIEDEPTIKVENNGGWSDTVTLTFKGREARARDIHNTEITLYIDEVEALIEALKKEANLG